MIGNIVEYQTPGNPHSTSRGKIIDKVRSSDTDYYLIERDYDKEIVQVHCSLLKKIIEVTK